MIMKIALTLVLAAAPAWPLQTDNPRGENAADAGSLTLDARSIRIENVTQRLSVDHEPPTTFERRAAAPILWDGLANVGPKFWAVIEANHPALDVRTKYATAIPRGVARWTDMTGWQPPRANVYELTAKNIYGVQVIRIRYQVTRTYGGQYRGKGRYLTAVAVNPTLVDVSWGYTCALDASVPDSGIVNVGTTADPIAGLTATLTWRLSTSLGKTQGQSLYFLEGDGSLREVGGPFRASSFNGGRTSTVDSANGWRAVDTTNWKR